MDPKIFKPVKLFGDTNFLAFRIIGSGIKGDEIYEHLCGDGEESFKALTHGDIRHLHSTFPSDMLVFGRMIFPYKTKQSEVDSGKKPVLSYLSVSLDNDDEKKLDIYPINFSEKYVFDAKSFTIIVVRKI